MPSSSSNAQVIATGIVILRALRHMLEISTIVPLTSNGSDPEQTKQSEAKPHEAVNDIIELQVHLQPFATPPLAPAFSPNALDAIQLQAVAEASRVESLQSLEGQWLWLLVTTRFVTSDSNSASSAAELLKECSTDGKVRFQYKLRYQFPSSLEWFVLPLDHSNLLKLRVTKEMFEQINTGALVLELLRCVEHEEPDKKHPDSAIQPQPVNSAIATTPPPQVSADNIQAVLADVEAKRVLAEQQYVEAEAHRVQAETLFRKIEAERKQVEADRLQAEVSRSLAETKSAEIEAHCKEIEFQRAQADTLRAQAEFQAKKEAEQAEKLSVLVDQQVKDALFLQQQLQEIAQEKQKLLLSREQLEVKLLEKDAFMQSIQQNNQRTDQALALLQEQLKADSKAREDLQQKLKELQDQTRQLSSKPPKSTMCLVQ